MHFTPQHPRLTATVTMLGALALVGTTFAGTAWAGGHESSTGRSADRSTSAVRDHDGDADHEPSTRITESADGSDANGASLHPSGNDRSVEPGGSGNQGKAESDPDGMSNGGVDKPGGQGGVYTGDQDGNNGCGNDNDFEDDNNGNCGGPAHERGRTPTAPEGSTGRTTPSAPTPPAATVTPEVGGATAGAGATADTCPTPGTAGTAPTMVAGCELAVTAPAAVLLGVSQPGAGEVLAAEAVALPVKARSAGAAASATTAATTAGTGSALAFTGLHAASLLLLALVALAIGWVLVRFERRTTA